MQFQADRRDSARAGHDLADVLRAAGRGDDRGGRDERARAYPILNIEPLGLTETAPGLSVCEHDDSRYLLRVVDMHEGILKKGEFVIDGLGNLITTKRMIEPAPHNRELRVRARTGSDIDPSCSLLDVGYISMEEECKGRTDISDCIDMSRLTDTLPLSSSGSSNIVGCMGRAKL